MIDASESLFESVSIELASILDIETLEQRTCALFALGAGFIPVQTIGLSHFILPMSKILFVRGLNPDP
jgi:hypothetical protein